MYVDGKDFPAKGESDEDIGVEYKSRYLEIYSYEYDSLNRLLRWEKLGSISGFKTSKKYTYNTNGTICKIEIVFSKKNKTIERSLWEFIYSYQE